MSSTISEVLASLLYLSELFSLEFDFLFDLCKPIRLLFLVVFGNASIFEGMISLGGLNLLKLLRRSVGELPV